MQHINNAFSSYFIVIYDGVLYFWEEIFFLEIVLKTKYLCIALGMWECSSVVEHSMQIERSVVQFRFLSSSLQLATCRKTLDV